MVTGKNRENIPSWSCTSFSKNGKENCTDSKTIREEMVKEAFVDSYKLLCSNTKFESDELFDIIKQAMNDDNTQEKLEKLTEQYSNIKSKKSKLIDLMVEEKYLQKIIVKKLKSITKNWIH